MNVITSYSLCDFSLADGVVSTVDFLIGLLISDVISLSTTFDGFNGLSSLSSVSSLISAASLFRCNARLDRLDDGVSPLDFLPVDFSTATTFDCIRNITFNNNFKIC